MGLFEGPLFCLPDLSPLPDPREVLKRARAHAGKWQSWDSNRRLPGSRAPFSEAKGLRHYRDRGLQGRQAAAPAPGCYLEEEGVSWAGGEVTFLPRVPSLEAVLQLAGRPEALGESRSPSESLHL